VKVDELRELLKGVPDFYDVVIDSEKGDKVAPIVSADTQPVRAFSAHSGKIVAFVLQRGYWW
jgi:hypothetical protein